jgi:hypothetical protein
MSAIKWMKWLSVIAFIMVAISFVEGFYTLFFSADDWSMSGEAVTLFCLSLWAVIVSFKKDSVAVVKNK